MLGELEVFTPRTKRQRGNRGTEQVDDQGIKPGEKRTEQDDEEGPEPVWPAVVLVGEGVGPGGGGGGGDDDGGWCRDDLACEDSSWWGGLLLQAHSFQDL